MNKKHCNHPHFSKNVNGVPFPETHILSTVLSFVTADETLHYTCYLILFH